MLRILCILVVLVVVESACHKKHAQPLPYIPPPPTMPAPASAGTTAPAQLEQPPAIPPAQTQAPPPVPADTSRYQVNKPPQPKKPKKAPPQQQQQPATPAAAAAAPPATPPRLGDILTPDQQREYSAAIDQSLSHAQASLGSIGNRQLTRDQQALVDQIRSFMQQAAEARKSDLQGAKRLAERAEVLSGDLAASFR